MTGRRPAMGVVVVNYASHELLERHLAPLTGVPDLVVVVVDNWSGAAERAAVTALGADRGWRVLGLPDNRGFGAGAAAGVAQARALGCVTFLLLNPDASIAPDVVAQLHAHSLREPLALISPRIVDSSGRPWFDGAVVSLRDGRIRRDAARLPGRRPADAVDWLTGACLVVHAELLDRLGGLPEDYFLYWEDVELSWRCRAVGGHLVLRRDLVAVHDAGGTQGPAGGRAKSALYYRYNCRNRLLFAARNLPRRRFPRWLVTTPAVSREVLLRGGRRQLLSRPGLLLAAARGASEGTVLVLRALLTRRPGTGPGDHVLVVHPGAELYGSDRMLLESVTGLVGSGLRVTVALGADGPLAGLLRAEGATVVRCRMPVARKSALRPRGMVALAGDLVAGLPQAVRLVRSAGAAGVHVSTQTVPSWILLARLLRRRVTVHVHEAEGAAPRALRLLLALPVVLAAQVLLNSRYSRRVLADSLPGRSAARVLQRAVVVPNGVRPPRTRPVRADLAGPVELLYLGRLSPRKGPDVALEALAELRRRGVPARLTLAGSVYPGYEWFEAELRRRVADQDLAGDVTFLGFVDDVSAALDAADVVLVPSRQDEPFGNTAVEAVLAGRPVVVSGTSGLLEAVDGCDSAQAVTPGDVGEWADAVQRAVEQWSRFAAAATADAAAAAARHDVGAYRSRVAALVRGAAA